MNVELIAITQYLRGDGTPEELLEHATQTIGPNSEDSVVRFIERDCGLL